MLMLVSQYSAPDRTVTSPELATATGYVNWRPVNAQYGNLGHLLSDALNCRPEKRANGKYRWWSILSSGEEIPGQGYKWTMHLELAEALEELKWVKK